MILAIDTATEVAGLALVSTDGIIAEEIWHAGRNHTVELSPRLQALLERATLSPADLSGIAVCIGPGSYTGVRIGVAVAKGLALPHNVPVIGVSSLEITSFPFRDSALPVMAIVRAGRKRLIAAQYQNENDTWGETQPPHTGTATELADALAVPTRVIGEMTPAEAEIFRAAGAQVAGVAHRVRRPSVLAELGLAKLAAGASGDLADVQPIYMKKPGE